MNRRILSVFLALCMTAALLCACAVPGQQEIADTIRVTDCVGRTVDVPKDPQSICCVCPFSGPMIVMFGYGDRVTTSCNNMTRSNLLTMMCPSIADAVVVKSSGSVNAEAVLEYDTDLIFVNDGTYETPEERAKLDSLGIPYVVVGFDDLESQLEAMLVIGRALDAEDKAQDYVDWCKGVYADVEKSLSDESGETVNLYHAVNEATRTDYAGSICDEWITMTNVNDVSLSSDLSVEGGKAYTTLEQIYAWDPDMIICNEAGVDDYIMTDEKWAGLRCVRNGTVYQIPVGISRMGHPTSTETPLALMWLANLLYPEQYDIDFAQELKDYYLRFYDFEIDDDMVQAILQGDEMRSAKTSQKAE